MSIGQVIKVVREERGLTQSQFAHELFVTQQALSRWEKGTADPSIDMIRLISTRFEVPMARLMEMPDNGFCQSCAMPFYRPEDHGTEPDGTRSGDYCNYCYDDGVFLQDYANSDELVAACAPMMAESCHHRRRTGRGLHVGAAAKPQAVAASGRDRCGGGRGMSDGVRL